MKFNEYQARVINTIVENTDKGYLEVIAALKTLKRAAATLHRLDENACNGHPQQVTEYRDGKKYVYSVEDIKWRERDEKKEERINQKIEVLAKEFGWTFERQGDPRGFPFYVRVTTKDNREINIADVLA
jgi:hypothetical protein